MAGACLQVARGTPRVREHTPLVESGLLLPRAMQPLRLSAGFEHDLEALDLTECFRDLSTNRIGRHEGHGQLRLRRLPPLPRTSEEGGEGSARPRTQGRSLRLFVQIPNDGRQRGTQRDPPPVATPPLSLPTSQSPK